MNFTFVGSLSLNQKNLRTGTQKDGSDYKSLGLVVSAGRGNRAFVELFGSKPSSGVMKLPAKGGGHVSVEWQRRFEKETIDKVIRARQHTLSLEDKQKTYISEYDMIEDLFKLRDAKRLEGKTFAVTGQVVKGEYNGMITTRYRIGNIYETNRKPGFTVSGDVYFTAGSIDFSDLRKENTVMLNGYTEEYVADRGSCYVPVMLTYKVNPDDIDAAKFDLSQIGIDFEEGKPKVKLKKSKAYRHNIICEYYNGVEIEEFSEKSLTETQRLAIKYGRATVDSFRPKNGQGVAGERKTYLRIDRFNLSGDYADGYVEENMTTDELEEKILKPGSWVEQKAETVVEPEPEPAPVAETESDPWDEGDII